MNRLVINLRTITGRGNLRARADVEIRSDAGLILTLDGCRVIQATELPSLAVEAKHQRVVNITTTPYLDGRMRIATELLGKIEWTDTTHGFSHALGSTCTRLATVTGIVKSTWTERPRFIASTITAPAQLAGNGSPGDSRPFNIASCVCR